LPPASIPAQIPLIEYTNVIGGAGFNFVLGDLVSGFSGYLSNNVANSSVDLVFVSLPAAPPGFGAVNLSGTNLVFSGTNGVPDWPYLVLASTNLNLPIANWTRVATNQFDADGGFIFTNGISAGSPWQFFILQVQ